MSDFPTWEQVFYVWLLMFVFIGVVHLWTRR